MSGSSRSFDPETPGDAADPSAPTAPAPVDDARGRRWGPLIVLERLDSGHFGVVFRARDPSLGRDVALKLLRRPQEDPAASIESVLREGQLLARVSHPNVMAVYGAQEIDGQVGIWGELLRGRTLAEIVRSEGPFSAPEALVFADAICRALAAVHRAGLLHRDVKAQNVMREAGGRVVLMDFGLGRDLRTHAAEGTLDVAGTPHYLAPELFIGRSASVRSDIYAVGVLMFFLVTASFPVAGRTFEALAEGHRQSRRQRLQDLRPDLPVAFVQVVERALAVDPVARFESSGAMQSAIATAGQPLSVPPPRTTSRPARATALAGVVLLLAGSWVAIGRWSRPAVPSPLMFSLEPPAGSRLSASLQNVAAISPDGQYVAFVATDQAGISRLWVRSLRSLDVKPVVDSRAASNPFWAPDSSAVAFFGDNGLKRVSMGGVRSETLATAIEERGGTWSAAGVLLIAPGPRQGLFRIPPGGGALQPVITPDPARGEIGYMWPQFLPDGRRFIYFVLSNDAAVRGIYLGSLDGRLRKRLVASDASAVLAGDHLLFVRDGNLAAQKFDAQRETVVGTPTSVVDQVAANFDYCSAVSASDTGVLVYSPASTADVTQLAWYDRTGRQLATVESPGRYRNPALSPNGRYLAVQWYRDTLSEIRVLDLVRGGAIRLAQSVVMQSPVWSPDGRLAYVASDTGWFDVYTRDIESTATPTLLVQSPTDKITTDWSSDGRFLQFTELSTNGSYDLWQVTLPPPGRAEPLLQGTAEEAGAKLSRDMKWLAYVSTESGQAEIYVRQFPRGPTTRRVSVNGGLDPSWGPGNELFFLDLGSQLMAAHIPDQDAAVISQPRRLFQTRVVTPGASRNHYALSHDGRRVLLNSPVGDAQAARLTVVANWMSLLSK
jgi:serine/threonine protein kinase/Tol biopolymer transport system component